MGTPKNLVLGGSGAIGAALCKELLSRGESVVNLDLKNGFDLRSHSLDAYEDSDYVWFLAWEVGGAKYLSNPGNLYRILSDNCLLCSHVFAFLERTKIPFLFTSSQLAAPDNAYGLTKLLGEQFAQTLGGIVVRFWNVYGWEEPGEKSHVITDMVLQALRRKKIKLLTTGEEERQFIYIDDCVRALCEIRKSSPSHPVHLTNGKWLKIIDLAKTVARLLDSSLEAGTAKGYQNKIDPDPSFRQFTWSTDLETGIRIMAASAERYIHEKSDVHKDS